MFERNAGTACRAAPGLPHRPASGRHHRTDEDVFGDTVNLAARLQGLAEPGSIVLSASVHEQVRDKLALPFRVPGARTLKNIDRPIQIYALDASGPLRSEPSRRKTAAPPDAGGAAGPRWVAVGGHGLPSPSRPAEPRASGAGSTESGLSVAVLPFRQPERRCRPGLFLRRPHRGHHPRARPLQGAHGDRQRRGAALPGKELPLAEIGRALNARYLVSGSVRRMGQRVRVTVQLSDAANSTQLWSEQYDDELSDIFAVQERIARRIAGTLASSLQQIALQQSLRKPTDNLDAYDLLLRARALAADPTRAGNRSARELLERVTQLAPGYADAYAELADSYFQRDRFGWSEFAQTDIETAIRLPRKPSSSTRNASRPQRAGARLHVVLKYDRGLAESGRALKINPSDAEVLLRGRPCCCGPAASTNRSPLPKPPCASTPISVPGRLNLGLAYLLAPRYADEVRLLEAARARYRPIRCSTSPWPPPTPSAVEPTTRYMGSYG